MEAARPKPKPNVAGRAERAEEAESLVDFCARPTCRTEFRRTIGPGRKQAYCSEMCRRQAERELRQKRISLAHFERVVEMLRVDIAAFGKTDFDTADNEGQSLDVRRTAEDAVRRATGALAFANPDEPAVRELQRLYNAVAPLVLPGLEQVRLRPSPTGRRGGVDRVAGQSRTAATYSNLCALRLLRASIHIRTMPRCLTASRAAPVVCIQVAAASWPHSSAQGKLFRLLRRSFHLPVSGRRTLRR